MIYAIQAGENGPIKIGYAKDIKSRMAAIQTGCPEQLTLLGACPTSGDEQTEKWLHKLNSAFRIRGEWFKPGYMVMETVEAIQQGRAWMFASRHWVRCLLSEKGQFSTVRQFEWLLEQFNLQRKWHGKAHQ